VIEVREAAVALACASANVGHAVIAKREVSRLFTDSSVYKSLFNEQTDPLRLSRAVEVTARTDQYLDEVEKASDGVTSGVAVHGRRVIAHLVMRKLGDKALRDPDTNMDDALADLDTTVLALIGQLVTVFPANAYPGNVFKNQWRVASLLKDAGLAGPT
jgi:hypothetical protein